MAIELMKHDDRVNLSSLVAGLDRIIVGVSWGANAVPPAEKDGTASGFFKGLWNTAKNKAQASMNPDIDIDSSVALVDANGVVKEIVYYGEKKGDRGNVKHAGDDLTGKQQQGVYDNEEIYVSLGTLSKQYTRLLVVVNIFKAHDRKQTFGQTPAYVRIMKDNSKREEIVRYQLDGDYHDKTAIVVGEFLRLANGTWEFHAIGKGTKDGSIDGVVSSALRG